MSEKDTVDFSEEQLEQIGIREKWFNLFKGLKRMELDEEVEVELIIDFKDKRNNFTLPKGAKGTAIAIFPGTNGMLVKIDQPDFKASLEIPVNYLMFSDAPEGLTITVGQSAWSCPCFVKE